MIETKPMSKLKRQEIFGEMNFNKEVLKERRPVSVEFVTEWSGACHIVAPVIERAVSHFNGRVKFCCVDIDKNNDIAKTYGIQNIPTLLFFRSGIVEDYITGAFSEKILDDKLNKMLRES